MTPPARPLVIAHAACAGHAPENTLAGIRKALSLNADAIEVDVRPTADGVPVLMHDQSVDRTTDGRSAIASLTLAEVKRLDAGATAFEGAFRGEPVPTLAEALELIRGRALLIAEIKCAGIEPQVAEVIAHANAQDAVMVWSFLPQALANMRKAAPHLPHVLLSEETASDWPRIRQSALDLGLQGVSLHHRHLSPDTVRDARQADLSVYAWTLDSEQDIRGAIALGVDGIVSNYPERVRAALSA